MRVTTLSIAGIISGAAFSIGSFIRYYILYPDIDKVIAYVLIGLVVCGFAWLYGKQVETFKQMEEIEERLIEIDFQDTLKGGNK